MIRGRDRTAEAHDTFNRMNGRYISWRVWPFTFTVMTAVSGSKTYMLEFRPVRKFVMAVSLFWKAQQ